MSARWIPSQFRNGLSLPSEATLTESPIARTIIVRNDFLPETSDRSQFHPVDWKHSHGPERDNNLHLELHIPSCLSTMLARGARHTRGEFARTWSQESAKKVWHDLEKCSLVTRRGSKINETGRPLEEEKGIETGDEERFIVQPQVEYVTCRRDVARRKMRDATRCNPMQPDATTM